MTKELVKILKSLNVVSNRRVMLKNAGNSSFYVDIKKAYGNPEALNLMAQELWEQIDKSATCVAGEGFGGMPLATAISLKYDLNLALIRSTKKAYGTKKSIEGYQPVENDKIIVVDDVLTTGGSLNEVIETLKSTPANIIGGYIICKRGESNLSIPIKYLITPKDLS